MDSKWNSILFECNDTVKVPPVKNYDCLAKIKIMLSFKFLLLLGKQIFKWHLICRPKPVSRYHQMASCQDGQEDICLQE